MLGRARGREYKRRTRAPSASGAAGAGASLMVDAVATLQVDSVAESSSTPTFAALALRRRAPSMIRSLGWAAATKTRVPFASSWVPPAATHE